MRSVWFVARSYVAHLLRHRETLLWTFVMPIVFFYFIGTITGGMSVRGSVDRPDLLALKTPANAGALVDETGRRLEKQNFRVTRPATSEEFERAGRRLVVSPPASGRPFSEAVLSGERQVLVFRNMALPSNWRKATEKRRIRWALMAAVNANPCERMMMDMTFLLLGWQGGMVGLTITSVKSIVSTLYIV